MYPYNQYYQQPAYQGGIMWGDYNDAVNYPLAPNSVITIWDRNGQSIYWKQSDAAGRQIMRVLDYKDRVGTPEEAKPNDVPATKDDLQRILDAVAGIKEMLKGGEGNA